MVSDFRLRQIAQNIYDKKPGYSFEKVLRLYPKYFIKIHMYYRSIELQHMKELEKAMPTVNKLAIKNTMTSLRASLNSLAGLAAIAIKAHSTTYNFTGTWQEQREQLIIACQNEVNVSRAYIGKMKEFRDNWEQYKAHYLKLAKYLGQPTDTSEIAMLVKLLEMARNEVASIHYYQELEQAAREADNADQFEMQTYSVMRKYSGD